MLCKSEHSKNACIFSVSNLFRFYITLAGYVGNGEGKKDVVCFGNLFDFSLPWMSTFKPLVVVEKKNHAYYQVLDVRLYSKNCTVCS